jgi:hypothetical protein
MTVPHVSLIARIDSNSAIVRLGNSEKQAFFYNNKESLPSLIL